MYRSCQMDCKRCGPDFAPPGLPCRGRHRACLRRCIRKRLRNVQTEYRPLAPVPFCSSSSGSRSRLNLRNKRGRSSAWNPGPSFHTATRTPFGRTSTWIRTRPSSRPYFTALPKRLTSTIRTVNSSPARKDQSLRGMQVKSNSSRRHGSASSMLGHPGWCSPCRKRPTRTWTGFHPGHS